MAYIGLDSVSVRLLVCDGAIRLTNLPTSFRREKVGSAMVSQRYRAAVIRALKDISLKLEDGNRLCLVGHDGAGKTILLRLLAGIYLPSGGSVQVDCKVVALLSNSMALNPEGTGYGSIRLAARIAGIQEFSELGEYLWLPKRASSGDIDEALDRGANIG